MRAFGDRNLPAGSDYIAVTSSIAHCLALKSDGSIIGWGYGSEARPPDGNDYVRIGAGGAFWFAGIMGFTEVSGHSLALSRDGSLVGWGAGWGMEEPPVGNDFVQIAAGALHGLALRSDGSFVGWGENEYGQTTAPEGNGFTAIAAGPGHSLALKSDGSIVGWGLNEYGEATTPEGNDYVAIAAGGTLTINEDSMEDFELYSYSAYSLALRRDGSIVGWGDNSAGWATPPDGNDFVAIAGGPGDPLALRSDGSIVSWGDGHATPPKGNDFVAIAVGTTCSLAIREPRKYGGGTGEPNDPYLLYTAEHLNALGAEPNDYDKHFKLMADIDLSGYVYDRAVIAPDVNDAEAGFQGTPFTGVFDGNGRKILHLTIAGVSYLGLFGQLDWCQVTDLGLVDVNITGSGSCVGGLAGENWSCITRSYSSGTVTGNGDVGGLVGSNNGGITVDVGSVTCCFSTSTVHGNGRVGGLVGDNDADILCSYSMGNVTGVESVGGLVGSNWGADPMSSILACYSTGLVTGERDLGGLVGLHSEPGRGQPGEVLFSFWDIETSGQTDSSGGTGVATAELQAAATFVQAGWGCDPVWTVDEGKDYPRLWWEDMPGQLIDEDLSGVLQGEGTEANPYLIYTLEDAVIVANVPCAQDSHFRLMFLEGDGTPENPYLIRDANEIQILQIFPHQWDKFFRLIFVQGEGTAESPYLIYTANELDLVGMCPYELDKHFRLMANIDLSAHKYNRAVIAPQQTSAALGFNGISFRGVFDGNGYAISHLTVVGGKGNYVGLFGLLEHGAEVRNLSVVDVNVTGWSFRIGGLAGLNGGTIATSCCTGTVTGTSSVGGLVGHNWGSIIASYSTGTVTGSHDVGGLVGDNCGSIRASYSTDTVSGEARIGGLMGSNHDSVSMSYSTGKVEGNENVGGLVGFGGRITSGFWDVETSGLSNMCGSHGIGMDCDDSYGKTTAEMQMASTFLDAGWDFVDETENGTDDIWWILEGQDYPRLWWETGEEESP